MAATAGSDEHNVMIDTRSLVAAWFSLSITLGAPAISRVLTHLEPPSLKCTGFSSMLQIQQMSTPVMCQSRRRTLMTFSHMARSRSVNTALVHLKRMFGFRKTTL